MSNIKELVPDGIPKEVNDTPQKPQKLTTHQEIEKILHEHGNKESDIPIFHRYWSLLNLLRSEKSV